MIPKYTVHTNSVGAYKHNMNQCVYYYCAAAWIFSCVCTHYIAKCLTDTLYAKFTLKLYIIITLTVLHSVWFFFPSFICFLSSKSPSFLDCCILSTIMFLQKQRVFNLNKIFSSLFYVIFFSAV